jgi:hypothetical protein
VLVRLPERLGRRVGRHQRHAAGLEVRRHGRQCRAQLHAARSSFSLLMYITASWMKTASKARPSLTVRMSPGTCSHSDLSTADLAHPVCRLDEGQRERPLHVRGVAAVAV